MDTLCGMEKLNKIIPIGLLIGCIMVDYSYIKSVMYRGFSDNVTEKIKSVFKNHIMYSGMGGTIITSKHPDKHPDKSVDEKYWYPSAISSEGICVQVIVQYKKQKDIILEMYYNKIGSKEKKIMEKIYDFAVKINEKIGSLRIDIIYHKYFSFSKINEMIINKKKLNKEHKEHINWLFLKYGYVLDNKNTFLNKNSVLLLNVLRLIEMETKGFFSPTDLSVKRLNIKN